MLVLIIGIVLLFSVKLTDNPYRKLWQEPLLFDKAVKAELNTAYAEKKKFLQLFNLLGIALIALGFLFFPFSIIPNRRHLNPVIRTRSFFGSVSAISAHVR